jgi:hypothetical protein
MNLGNANDSENWRHITITSIISIIIFYQIKYSLNYVHKIEIKYMHYKNKKLNIKKDMMRLIINSYQYDNK